MSASIQVLTRAIQPLEILTRKDAPMCLAEIAEASGLPKSSAYPVSKAGFIMFTKCLAVEYAAEGIRANAFCPGQLLTDMNVKRYAREAAAEGCTPEETMRRAIATVPLGRIGTPRDVGLAAAFPVFLGFSFRLPCILHQQTESRPMKPHETAFPCETPRLSFRMAGPSCTEGMVTYWPHSAAVTEAGACGGLCQGMHEGINGGGRRAGSQSQEKGLFRFAILSKETGNAVGTLECSSATEGNDSAKTMWIGLAGQHDSESYLEEALRFAVLTLIPAHALRGLRVIVPHAHERVSLLKQYGFEPSEEGGPALFQRADRTYFDAGKGMALCGLACCVCSENPTCAGCRNEGCKDRSWCQPFNCCKQKKLNGCWECPAFPCDNPMFNKQRVRAFAAFVLEHGEAALIRALQKNEADGVLYHYPGRLVGDYDLPESGSAIRAMLLRGLEAAQDARS